METVPQSSAKIRHAMGSDGDSLGILLTMAPGSSCPAAPRTARPARTRTVTRLDRPGARSPCRATSRGRRPTPSFARCLAQRKAGRDTGHRAFANGEKGEKAVRHGHMTEYSSEKLPELARSNVLWHSRIFSQRVRSAFSSRSAFSAASSYSSDSLQRRAGQRDKSEESVCCRSSSFGARLSANHDPAEHRTWIRPREIWLTILRNMVHATP
jgi:hypothetical protein